MLQQHNLRADPSRNHSMSTLPADRFQLIQQHLDRALSMSEHDLPAWLASVRADDPAIADELQDLLHEHQVLRGEHFLEGGAPALADRPVLAGEVFGAYTLLSPIGEGGMGTVWLAARADGRFARHAAVKLLRVSLLSRGAERFTREGHILARLTHPHIAHLLDAGISPAGQPFLVLEHVDGLPIDRYCDERLLDVENRVRLFLDVLEAVAHAHANLVVHRDIKPSNVLVTADGQVKLLDFGIAKLLEDERQAAAATMVTREAGTAMTLEYAAPEQVNGEAVSTATDVYALGILMFLLLTGRHPAGPGPHAPAALIKAIVEIEPPRLSDVVRSEEVPPETRAANARKRATTPDRLRRALRGDLETIAAKALKKAPEERYASVGALADDLRRYLSDEPVSARPDTVPYRAAKFVRRNRAATAFAVLAMLATVAGIAATIVQARGARDERDFALRELSRAEAINDLNTFLLSDAAPSGKPLTVNELLARAEHVVRRQRGDQRNRAMLLIAIGRQYWSQDGDAAARRVLTEAYDISRTLTDPSPRARAAAALAAVLVRSGQADRAEALIQQALDELPGEARFVRDRLFCLQCASYVARERGAAKQAIARATEASMLLARSAWRSDLLELRLFMDQAESYRAAGQHRKAAAAFEQAARRLTALGRDDTATAGTLYNNWALALGQLGRPRESEALFRRAIDLSRADNTERAVSPMLLVNYARALLDLGRTDEAADYAERGRAQAEQAGDQVVVNQSMLLLGQIYCRLHDLARASAMLDGVEPRLRRALPPGHLAFAALMSYRALVAGARGDLATAVELDNRAIAAIEASVRAGGEGADYLPRVLTQRSEVELGLHRVGAAEADAARAVTLLESAAEPGTFSAALGRAYLTLGRALLAQGRRQQTRAAVQAAERHLENELGPDNPETRAALQLERAN